MNLHLAGCGLLHHLALGLIEEASKMGILDVEDILPYPCPKCGEYRVLYEGMLVWRSGPRPPRKLARKQIVFSARADVERERIYHCEHCGAEFFQDVEQSRVHLYEEGVSGQYTYNGAWKTWQHRAYDPDERKWKTTIFDKAEGRWVEQ
jgi:predicted RNA-binding Zn-ribbon protein involved in translation (DUF1610 family)